MRIFRLAPDTAFCRAVAGVFACLLLGPGCGQESPQPTGGADPPPGTAAAGADLPKSRTTSNQPDKPRETETEAPSPLARGHEVIDGHVGSKACGQCHAERFMEFNATHHARSLRKPDRSIEAELEHLVHESSDQSFRVQWTSVQGTGAAGQMSAALVHAGWKETSSPTEVPPERRLGFTRHPIDWVMGSGAFGRSYLFTDGDYFGQSPLTFYTRVEAYEMSPGYDVADHLGFTRPVTAECLFCHGGIVETVDHNPNRMRIQEHAIGCERCHGPGLEHTRRFSASSPGDAGELAVSLNTGIVNPAKLDRSDREDLCAQCHLQTPVLMYPAQASAGKAMDAWSFRPGDSLSERRIHYRPQEPFRRQGPREDPSPTADSLQGPESVVEFVGHHEQMRSSLCYTRSDILTCISCHDPHHRMDASRRHAAYRDACLACHSTDDCGETLPRREAAEQDSCFRCHMPRGKSEVPHAAVTNHFIAVHRAGRSVESPSPNLRRGTVEPATDSVGSDSAGSESSASDAGEPRLAESSSLPKMVAVVDGSDANSWQRERNALVATGLFWLDQGTLDGASSAAVETLVQKLNQSLRSDQAEPGDLVVNDFTARLTLARLALELAGMTSEPTEPNSGDSKTRATTTTTGRTRGELYYQLHLNELRWIVKNATAPGPDLQQALALYGNAALDQRDYNGAAVVFQRLTRQRRQASDWYHLALVHGKQRRPAAAEACLNRSLEIDSHYWRSYRALSRLYRSVAPERSALCDAIAKELRRRR